MSNLFTYIVFYWHKQLQLKYTYLPITKLDGVETHELCQLIAEYLLDMECAVVKLFSFVIN